MAELIIPAAYREAHYAGLARYKQTGEARVLRRRVELSALRADGSEFPVELTITAIGVEEQPQFTAYLRDITERRRLEDRLKRSAMISELLFKASRSIGEADSFTEALRLCLEIICEISGWPVGHVYLPDEAAGELVPADIWHMPTSASTEEFRLRTLGTKLKPGIGLPGRVWQSGEPLWISDLKSDSNFVRHEGVGELRSGIAFPIMVAGQTIAVLEFFTRTLAQPEPELLAFVQTVAQQIGGVLQRKRQEQTIRDSEERYRWLLDSTTDAVWRFELDAPVSTGLREDGQIELFYRHAYLAEANASMARMYGFERPEEMIGIRLGVIMPMTEAGNIAYLKDFIRSGYALRDTESVERTKTGETRYISNTLIGVVENGMILRAWGTSQDITNRRLAELQIRSALAQKEVLLREVHHRVKNNLQMIAAMIQLRARLVPIEIRPHFEALTRRVVAIGNVYEEIHRAGNLDQIDLGQYLRKIGALSSSENVAVQVQAAPLQAGIDVAVPIGLIAVELITNSVKHAFGPEDRGVISIQLGRLEPNRAFLVIADNGRGMQAAPNRASSGLEIVRALASQIEAEIETSSDSGTSHKITFPL
jgi:two-component sensor histidine kinase/PAS domain-containing protein